MKLMQAFHACFNEKPPSSLPGRNNRLQRTIQGHLKTFHKFEEGAAGREKFIYLKALRDALRDVDEVLTGRAPSATELNCTSHEKMPVQQGLPTEENEKHKKRRVMVQDVLRSHLQEVLRLLNETDERAATISETLAVPNEKSASSPGSQRLPEPVHDGSPSFQDMNAASPDERQHKFMQVYFDVVCPLVVSNAEKSTMNRRASISRIPLIPPPVGHELRRRSSGRSNLGSGNHLVPRDKSPVPSIAIRTMSDDFEGALRRQSVDVHPQPRSPARSESIHDAASIGTENEGGCRSLADEEVSHADIWYTLVFRMICWLTLHDFNKMDVQLPKSELRGSRMPVYIS